MQNPAAAAFQRPQKQFPHSDPLQTPHFQTEEPGHTPDLPVFPFGKHKFITAVSQNTDLLCPEKIPLIGNPLFRQKADLILR